MAVEMGVMRATNPPCEACGTETLHGSDPSGGWNECPACGFIQNVHYTPPGQGRLTNRKPATFNEALARFNAQAAVLGRALWDAWDEQARRVFGRWQ